MAEVLICSFLYPTESERSLSSNTFAVRELVESAKDLGLPVAGVIRFMPLKIRDNLWRPKVHLVNGIKVFDIPRIGYRLWFSATLTRLLINFLTKRKSTYSHIVCHMQASFYTAHRIFGKSNAKMIFVVHNSCFSARRMVRCLNLADSILARSHSIKERIVERYNKKVDGIVFSGIPNSAFSAPPTVVSPNCQELRAVIACTFIARKNVELSIQSLKIVADQGMKVRLDLFGDGPRRRHIEECVESLPANLTATVHGFCPKSKALDAMRNADLLLMPSENETFGLVFLEAMAQGCTVIGMKGTGIDGVVIDGENGFLAREASVAAVFSCIQRYIGSNRLQIKRNAWTTARAYNADAAAANYRDLVLSS